MIDSQWNLTTMWKRAMWATVIAALIVGLAPTIFAQQLNENCVVSILNRTTQVRADGTWDLPNIPAGFGPVRARATCVQNGITLSGQSDPFIIQPNRMNAIPPIVLGPVTPIPTSLAVTAPTTSLTQPNQTVQLTVTGTYASGPAQDLTAASTGTTYVISNTALASISPNGLVTAKGSGTVLVQAQNEGTQGLIQLTITLSRDSDGDGIPDDVEIALGLNPNNPADALDDPDHDGLNNRDEIARGTDIHNPDTDGDGLTDGQEVNTTHTNPLLADSDGDGVPDKIEVATGSDPNNPASYNLAAALSGIRVSPTTFVININAIEGVGFQQLTVTGDFKLGGTINLTPRARGTNYASSNLAVCNFGAEDGRAFGAADGPCTITITNSGFTATATGTVNNFTPKALSQLTIPGYANNVDVAGSYAYVAAGSTGLQVVSVSNPNQPVIVGSADTPGNANDVRIVGNLAFVADGSAGLRIFNVSNPLAPSLVGSVDTPGDAIDVMVFGNRAYIADGSAGLAVINITNPASPTILKQVDTPGTARGVDILQGANNTIYAIIADDSPSALRVINVTDPASASIVANLTLSGFPKDLRVAGSFAYIAAYTGGMQIVDLSNPLAPLARGSLPTQIVPRDVDVVGSFAILAEQLFPNAVPLVDITSPSSPILRTVIDFSPLGDYAGTGIAVAGPYLYMTGVSFVASVDKGVSGDTRLFIGQYLPQQDLFGIPPVVNVTAPPNNSSAVRGSTITLRANATDDIGVVAVTFSVNGTDVFTDNSAPFEAMYTVPANATTLSIVARAVDLGNNVGTSSAITVTGIADPLTTVSGRVLHADSTPVTGAAVTCAGVAANSAAGGTFNIANVPTVGGDITCSAQIVEGGKTLKGKSGVFAPVLGGITNVGDITVKTSGIVGYYDLTLNSGAASQVGPITTAGLQAVNVGNMQTADLSQFDVLFVQNPDNNGYASAYVSNLAKVNQFIANGGVLIFHDRAVATAASILPGSPGSFFREFSDPANINILDNTTLVTNGPGGVLDNSSLDGGNYSSHGWVQASTIPAGAKGILTTGTVTHLVLYQYPYGAGKVLYSTIPLDFYLGGTSGVGLNMTKYAANVVAYGNSIR